MGVPGIAEDVVVDSRGDAFVSIPALCKVEGLSGVPLWCKAFGGEDLLLDSSGNLLAWILVSGPPELVKLDSTSGAEQFRSSLSFNGVFDMALDTSGDVLIAGRQPNAHLMVTKNSGTTGVRLWRWDFGGPGSGTGLPAAIAVDPFGDVVATKSIPGPVSNTSDWLVVKLSGASGISEETGGPLWTTTIDGTASPAEGDSDDPWDVATDSNGDVIVCGRTQNMPDPGFFGISIFSVIKLSGVDGSELWRTRVHSEVPPGPSVGENGLARAVVVAPDDSIYAAGYTTETGFSLSFAVVKLDSESGSVVWRHTIDGEAESTFTISEQARAIALDSAGDVVAVGELGVIPPTGDFSFDFAVMKLSAATGEELWRTTLRGTRLNTFNEAHAVAIGPSGNVYAAGFVRDSKPSGVNPTVRVLYKLWGTDGTSAAPLLVPSTPIWALALLLMLLGGAWVLIRTARSDRRS